MDVIEIVLLILLVVVCIALGALVLIQQGRGSDIGAAFGSGAANTLFGSRRSHTILGEVYSDAGHRLFCRKRLRWRLPRKKNQ